MSTRPRFKGKILAACIVLTMLILTALISWLTIFKSLMMEQREIDRRLAECRLVRANYESLLARADQIDSLYIKLNDELGASAQTRLPPAENPMAWSGSLVQRGSVAAGIQENRRAFKELRQREFKQNRDQRNAPPLEEYGVALDLQCGYHQFGHLLASMENDVPFMRIDSFSINTGQRTAEKQLRISLKCFFPRFSAEGFPSELHPETRMPVIGGLKAPRPEGVDSI